MGSAIQEAGLVQAACKLRVLPTASLHGVLLGCADPQALFCLEAQPRLLPDRLRADGDRARALRFLARSLPGREAIWWACRCVSASLPAGAPPEERTAIEAAEAWVWQPVPERAAAGIAAAQPCAGRPAGWLGLAIAWGMRLRDPDAGFARGVSGAVLRAARRDLPPGAGGVREAARQDSFIRSALDIAAGQVGRIPSDEAAQSSPEVAKRWA